MLLSRNWWVFALRGLLALLFGVLAIFLPENTFISLVFLAGFYLIFDGIFTLISAFISSVSSEGWWWLVLSGIAGMLLGILTIWNPVQASVFWVTFMGVWAIWTGLMGILTAIRLRKIIDNEWILLLSGLISIIFGVIVVANPFSGMFAIGVVIGTFAIIWGVTLLMFAFRLKKITV